MAEPTVKGRERRNLNNIVAVCDAFPSDESSGLLQRRNRFVQSSAAQIDCPKGRISPFVDLVRQRGVLLLEMRRSHILRGADDKADLGIDAK